MQNSCCGNPSGSNQCGFLKKYVDQGLREHSKRPKMRFPLNIFPSNGHYTAPIDMRRNQVFRFLHCAFVDTPTLPIGARMAELGPLQDKNI